MIQHTIYAPFHNSMPYMAQWFSDPDFPVHKKLLADWFFAEYFHFTSNVRKELSHGIRANDHIMGVVPFEVIDLPINLLYFTSWHMSTQKSAYTKNRLYKLIFFLFPPIYKVSRIIALPDGHGCPHSQAERRQPWQMRFLFTPLIQFPNM